MRRIGTCILAVLALAALVSPALSQPSVFGPGGTIYVTTASKSVNNTVAETALFTYTVPAGLTQGNYAPLHLRLLGVVTTNQGVGATGAMNVGCNFGGSTASLAMANGFTLPGSLVRAPLTMDVWLNGYQGAAASTSITGAIQGRMTVGLTQLSSGASAGIASEAVLNSQADSTTRQNTSQILTCVMRWGSAATTNNLIITNGVLVQGN